MSSAADIMTTSITRYPGETDAELRSRIMGGIDHMHRNNLRKLLYKLGIKSASGLRVYFAGKDIRVPGAYANTKI